MPEDLEPTPLHGELAEAGLPAEPDRSPGSRPCPVCGRVMGVERMRKVKIDVCDEHGIWLDSGELEAITAGLRKRLRRSRGVALRAATRRAKKRGRAQGALLGWWSLLLD